MGDARSCIPVASFVWRWLDDITDSKGMSLNKLQEIVDRRKPGVLQSMGSQRARHDCQPLGCRDFRLQCGGSGEQLRPGVSSSHPSQVCTELSILLLLYPSSGQGMDEGMKERQRSSSRGIFSCGHEQWGFLRSSVSKESACTAGDLGLIPGLGRSPGEGNGNPLQYACLKNPMDRGAW